MSSDDPDRLWIAALPSAGTRAIECECGRDLDLPARGVAECGCGRVYDRYGQLVATVWPTRLP